MDSLELIPLRLLALSPVNVRQTKPAEAVDELADDILVRGLQQNLVGHAGEDPELTYIAAGGRRLQALQLLLERGAIEAEHLVPIKRVASDEAREASLSENLHKIALNPVDEYVAFARIVVEHAADPDPVGLCAHRQGVSRLRVERALRLADLAPEILVALRDGTIGVDVARAYASVPDHKLQLLVFNSEERRQFGFAHQPAQIRASLKMKTLPASDAKARYVGLDAYRDAGGRCSADLFAREEEHARLIDTTLLDTLVLDKAQAELPALVDAHGFGSGLLTQSFTEHPSWPPAPKGWLQQPLERKIEDLPKRGRVDLIGIYGLVDGDPVSLDCIGWYSKVKPSTFAGMPVQAPAAAPVAPRLSQPVPLPSTDERIADRRLQLAAAHIAVERVAGGALRDAYWPAPNDLVPAIAPGPDADTLVVAVLIHVRRTDVQASMSEAAELIQEEGSAAALAAIAAPFGAHAGAAA